MCHYHRRLEKSYFFRRQCQGGGKALLCISEKPVTFTLFLIEPGDKYMKTRITEMLNIQYPIIQGGMVHIAEPPLAAAVSNAGGLGILTGSLWKPEELAEKIRQVKKLTDKPFGLNFTPTCETLEENLDVCVEEKVTVCHLWPWEAHHRFGQQ